MNSFSLALSIYDYQILLCNATRGYVVTSFGPPSQKQLVLLYDDSHYEVITSLPGFFGTSYFGARCLKPYDITNSLWVANSNKNTGVATSRVLCVTITSKPCCIGASFKWLRLPRKNRRSVMPNEDPVVICVVLLPAWPPCTPTRTMCPPLLFFLHLLRTVSTSMTKNLSYTYSST